MKKVNGVCECGKSLVYESAEWSDWNGSSPEFYDYGECEICGKDICFDCLENQGYKCKECLEELGNIEEDF